MSGDLNLPAIFSWSVGRLRGARRIFLSLLIFSLSYFSPPLALEASDLSAERDLQRILEQSRAAIDRAEEKRQTRRSIAAEIAELQRLARDIRTSHLLLQERFRSRESEISVRGNKALERHRAMAEGYSAALQGYLNLLESLPPAESSLNL